MIVFKLEINGTKQIVGLEKGVFNIITDRLIDDKRNNIKLRVSGLDTSINRHVLWSDLNLKLGDKITIEIAEETNAEKIDEPIVKPKEDETQLIIESKLKSYNRLKKELEEKGLI